MAWTSAHSKVVSDMFSDGPVEESKLPFYGNTTWEQLASTNAEVTIVSVGDMFEGDYVPGTDISTPDGSASNAVLKTDQYRYISARLDKTQKLIGQYAEKFAQKGLKKLALASDRYVLSLVLKANFTTNWIEDGTTPGDPLDVNSSNILDVLKRINTLLDKQDVEDANRFIAVTPEIKQMIITAVGDKVVATDDVLFQGKAEKVKGLNIIMTNQYTDLGTDEYKCLFGHADAIAVAVIPPELEIGPMEKQFGQLIKGLMQHGAKIIEENLAGGAHLQVIAEA